MFFRACETRFLYSCGKIRRDAGLREDGLDVDLQAEIRPGRSLASRFQLLEIFAGAAVVSYGNRLWPSHCAL